MDASVVPHNLHDATVYIVWSVLVGAVAAQAVGALFSGEFKKAIAAILLVIALLFTELYGAQLLAELPSWKFFTLVAAVIYIMLIGSEFYSLRRDFDKLVAPRTLTSKQAKALQDYLSKCRPFSLTIKVNSLDQEAQNYASQIAGALRQTQWNVDFSTAENAFVARTMGLHIVEDGINSKVRDPKNDPAADIRGALSAARVPPVGGASVGAGDYKLSLVVGRRPLRLNQNTGILFRLANWFNNLGRKLHK